MLTKIINKLVGGFGLVLVKKNSSTAFDISEDKAFLEIYNKCKGYTMTSAERMYSLYKAVEYTVDNGLKGDLVECGVWKGGSAMLMALTLLQKGVSDRNIYMYDTFEGMSAPTAADVTHSGESAEKIFREHGIDENSSDWCNSPMDAVRSNLLSTRYPEKNLFFIKGKVEETLVSTVPSAFPCCDLDTGGRIH
jgi:hypothetical protein